MEGSSSSSTGQPRVHFQNPFYEEGQRLAGELLEGVRSPLRGRGIEYLEQTSPSNGSE